MGRISCGRTSSHQIAVRLVSERDHPAELYSYGGVSKSEITVCYWSSLSGFSSLYVGCTFLGCTFLGCTWRLWECISSQFGLLLYQVPLYILLFVLHLLLSSYIHIHSKLIFPKGVGGVIQGHVDQKYLCTKMHVLVS